jgi:predicted short-subunit dehydrogenase-like oxidoreductase (DUF2520 family)
MGAPDILAAVKQRSGKLKTRPKVAIVGAGRLGTTLAQRLAEAGYAITEIIVRNNSRSVANVRRLAQKVGAKAASLTGASLDADIIWFCVPDSQIAGAAADLLGHDWKNKIALHSSGVLSGDALESLRAAGASVASVHPLMTFVEKSKPDLEGVPFAVEGDTVAVRVATSVIDNLGGNCLRISKQNKIAYHAFATIICPLLVSLLAASEKVAMLAGISQREARRRMMPIIRQTFANYARLGPSASFSGPIVRGDTETIAQHLKTLSRAPEAKLVYVSLAQAALKLLPGTNPRGIAQLLLSESRSVRRNQTNTGRERVR